MDQDRPSHDHGVVDFDSRAATWDDPVKIDRARHVADAIIAATSPDGHTRLLEYGAGTGLVTEALGEAVGPVLLADQSEGMREVMATKVLDGRLRDATISDLDLADTDAVLPDERFDLIVTVLAMHHIGPIEMVLNRFSTLLASGGHLCVVDLDEEDGSFHGDGFGGHHGFDRTAFTSLLRGAGFTRVDVSDCGHVERDDGNYSMFLAVATTGDDDTQGANP